MTTTTKKEKTYGETKADETLRRRRGPNEEKYNKKEKDTIKKNRNKTNQVNKLSKIQKMTEI